MSSQDLTISELQWRSAELTASAAKVVVTVLRQPLSAVKHYSVRRSIDTVVEAISKLLTLIHAPDSIAALEKTTREQRDSLGQSIESACERIHMLIAQIDEISRSGQWRRWYEPRLEKIRTSNRQLRAHANSLRNSDTSFIMLTTRDQEFLLGALLEPQEPSEDLRRVFARK